MIYYIWMSKTLQIFQAALRVRGKFNLRLHVESQLLGAHKWSPAGGFITGGCPCIN
jgi:hypothetical protein